MPDTARACTLCRHTLTDQDHAQACEACVRHLRDQLTELRRQLRLLQDTMAPAGASLTARSTPAGASREPVRMDVLNLLGPGRYIPGTDAADMPVHVLLTAWARLFARASDGAGFRAWRSTDGTEHVERWCDGPRSVHGTGADAMARWLYAYLPAVADTAPWLGELRDDLHDVLRRCRSITGTALRRRCDAPCPACGVFRLFEHADVHQVVCAACGHRLATEDYHRHAAAVMPGLYRTAVLIAAHHAQTDAEARAAPGAA